MNDMRLYPWLNEEDSPEMMRMKIILLLVRNGYTFDEAWNILTIPLTRSEWLIIYGFVALVSGIIIKILLWVW